MRQETFKVWYLVQCMLEIWQYHNYMDTEDGCNYRLGGPGPGGVLSTLYFLICWHMAWGYHGLERFSALLALWYGNPLVTSGFPSQMASNVELLCFLCSECCLFAANLLHEAIWMLHVSWTFRNKHQWTFCHRHLFLVKRLVACALWRSRRVVPWSETLDE